MRITFLGGGNMANALISGMIRQGATPGNISVIEINEEIRNRLEQKLGLRCFNEPEQEALDCDVVVLAVKPQQMHQACLALEPWLRHHLVISIAAGLRLADLSRWLGGHKNLVRSMPNTPSLIGAGMTGLFAMPGVSDAERLGAERIMQSVGSALWVKTESALDGLTAISGSGPAYVFLFIESLVQASLDLGFSQKQARQMVLETILGSAKLAAQSDESAQTLRERVTSKGGTTEAALKVLAEKGFKTSLMEAVMAAATHSSDMGQRLGKD